MALENDVQDLTQAIKALAAAVAAQTAAFGNLPPPQPVEEVKKEVKKEKVATTATTQDTSTETKTLGSVSAEQPPSEDVAPEVSFEQLAAKFTDLIDLNRDAAVGLLKELGVAKLGLIDKAKYGSVFQQVSELLNG